MSTSSSNVSVTVRRSNQMNARRKFKDGLDLPTFKRMVAAAHREFFEARGYDAAAIRRGEFHGGFGRRSGA